MNDYANEQIPIWRASIRGLQDNEEGIEFLERFLHGQKGDHQ